MSDANPKWARHNEKGQSKEGLPRVGATEGRATTGKGYEGVIFLRCPFYIYRDKHPATSNLPHPPTPNPPRSGANSNSSQH